MSEFVNTVDTIGDEELCNRIIKRTITEYFDNVATSIGNAAFYGCSSLTDVNIPAVTSIGSSSFYGCSSLTDVNIPAVTKIGSQAFDTCKALTSITFKGKPNSIHSQAFRNCTNLVTINVPWAEGAVSGAPWGATKATINYNYTGV